MTRIVLEIPPQYTLMEQVMYLAQMLKGDYPDLARFLMAKEKQGRKKPGKRKSRYEVARNGARVRGGTAYLNLDNPDVRVEER